MKPDHPSGWPLDRYRSINALAETVVGLYKPECMMIDGPFRTADELKLATFSWVHWFKESRLHSSIGYLTPIEKENEYYRDINSQSRVQPPMTPGLPGSAGSASGLNGGLDGSRGRRWINNLHIIESLARLVCSTEKVRAVVRQPEIDDAP